MVSKTLFYYCLLPIVYPKPLSFAFSSAPSAGNKLTGSIPTELGKMIGLVEFDIHDNKFKDEIPSEIGYLTGLARLDLGT